MPYVLIIHEVEYYPAWKKVFDHAADIRKTVGELSFQLFCDDENPNRIVHFSTWDTLDKARRFFA